MMCSQRRKPRLSEDTYFLCHGPIGSHHTARAAASGRVTLCSAKIVSTSTGAHRGDGP